MKKLIVHIEYDPSEIDEHTLVEMFDGVLTNIRECNTGEIDIGWRYFRSFDDAKKWESGEAVGGNAARPPEEAGGSPMDVTLVMENAASVVVSGNFAGPPLRLRILSNHGTVTLEFSTLDDLLDLVELVHLRAIEAIPSGHRDVRESRRTGMQRNAEESHRSPPPPCPGCNWIDEERQGDGKTCFNCGRPLSSKIRE